VRHSTGEVERRGLRDAAEYRNVLAGTFGIALSRAELDVSCSMPLNGTELVVHRTHSLREARFGDAKNVA
jgi:hypothetical protein